MATYVPPRQKWGQFIMVYVFCEESDTVCYMTPSSGWIRFLLGYTDNGVRINATVYATAFRIGNEQFYRPQRPTWQLLRECENLLAVDFSHPIDPANLRAYPRLFAKLRAAGFIGKTVLVQHPDRGYTVYKLAPHGINVLSERKRA